MHIRNFLYIIGVAVIGAIFFGCKQEASTSVEPIITSHLTYQPKGTITGVVKNRTTDAPVEGAVVSIGYDGAVHSTTSDKAGAFSFADVPAGQYQIVNGTSVLSGTYTLTVSLLDYNASQTVPAKKYRNYYYSTATIKFTSLAPGDSLVVSDMVGSVVLQISYLNTTLTGQVVNQNMQPVANAVVSLYDATVVPNVVLAQAQTQANGRYEFTAVDNGLTVALKAVSADGALEGNLPATFTLPANSTSDSLRSQVTAERIMITSVDNVSPYVMGITPEQNADVAPGSFQIVYTFSEPIKQTSYTRTDLALGHNTIVDDIAITYLGLKKTEGALPFTAQWNAAFTQLTVTPQGIVGSARYTANIQTAFTSGKITDMAARSLVNNASITGDFELLQFTTSGGSTVPATPSLTRRFVAGLYANLDYTGGTVGLSWNYDANARSYNIYKSVNEGSFELLQKDVYGVQFADNTGSLVTPSAATNPFASTSVRYVVRGVSKDLVESASSNIIPVTDAVKPRLLNAVVAAGGSANTWTYTLSFSEPMKVGAAENGTNYSFSNTGGVTFAITAADYLGLGAGVYVVRLSVTTSAAPIAGYVLTVNNGVVDLAANAIDPLFNSRAF